MNDEENTDIHGNAGSDEGSTPEEGIEQDQELESTVAGMETARVFQALAMLSEDRIKQIISDGSVDGAEIERLLNELGIEDSPAIRQMVQSELQGQANKFVAEMEHQHLKETGQIDDPEKGDNIDAALKDIGLDQFGMELEGEGTEVNSQELPDARTPEQIEEANKSFNPHAFDKK